MLQASSLGWQRVSYFERHVYDNIMCSVPGSAAFRGIATAKPGKPSGLRAVTNLSGKSFHYETAEGWPTDLARLDIA
jgi:hypothetical protein